MTTNSLSHRSIRILRACFLILAVLAPLGAKAAPPPNDNFASRITLTGLNASAVINSLEQATVEGGEPNTNSSYPYSVWYQWTAPSDGIVRLDATGSQFYHDITLYYGTSLGTLKYIDFDSGNDSQSGFALMEYPVTQGSVFVIRYRGSSGYPYVNAGEQGFLYVNLRTDTYVNGIPLSRPSTVNNDMFANRIQLTGAQINAIGYQAYATREGGEPTSTQNNTTWWEWTSPGKGTVTIESQDTNDYLTLWSGTNIASLTYLGGDTNGDPVTIGVNAGSKVLIAIGTGSYPGPDASFISVNFTSTVGAYFNTAQYYFNYYASIGKPNLAYAYYYYYYAFGIYHSYQDAGDNASSSYYYNYYLALYYYYLFANSGSYNLGNYYYYYHIGLSYYYLYLYNGSSYYANYYVNYYWNVANQYYGAYLIYKK